MTHFDPDLIAALAEGSLDPTEAEALEREIATDPVASADLAAQRAALSFLGAVPDAGLTGAERTQLRSSVADALGLVPEASRPEPAPARRRVPWPAIAVAGASLVALVAIVPTIGLLSTGSDDAGDLAMTTVVAEETFDAEAAPQSERLEPVGEANDGAVPPAASGAGDERTDQSVESTGLDDDSLAAVVTTTAASADLMLSMDLDPGLIKALDDPAALATAGEEAILACRAEAVEVLGVELEPDLIATVVSLEGGGEAVVWFIPSETYLMETAAFDTNDCTLLFLNG